MKVRVFQNSDGSLRILRPNLRLLEKDETESVFMGRMGEDAIRKDPTLKGLPFIDMDDFDLPTDRSSRHRWRIVGDKIQIDPTIPDPVNPKDELIAKIARAKDFEELKMVVMDLARK